jgi:hypothetical protein
MRDREKPTLKIEVLGKSGGYLSASGRIDGLLKLKRHLDGSRQKPLLDLKEVLRQRWTKGAARRLLRLRTNVDS